MITLFVDFICFQFVLFLLIEKPVLDTLDHNKCFDIAKRSPKFIDILFQN